MRLESVIVLQDVAESRESLQVAPGSRPCQACSLGDLGDGETPRLGGEGPYHGQAALEPLDVLSGARRVTGGTLRRLLSANLRGALSVQWVSPLRGARLPPPNERMFAYRTQRDKRHDGSVPAADLVNSSARRRSHAIPDAPYSRDPVEAAISSCSSLWGIAHAACPWLPTMSRAATRALTMASSVASTVAPKSGSRASLRHATGTSGGWSLRAPGRRWRSRRR